MAARLSTNTRAHKINETLSRLYPDARCMLDFSNPLELLVATILAAQCTDKKVNEVTSDLFQRYRSAADFAAADSAQLQAEIRPTGFFRQKAKAIIACCRNLVGKHGGRVPDNMQELNALSGVGRKTANVVLGAAFGKPAVIVDTHVRRVAARLGLTRHSDPDKIEGDLQKLVPPKEWTAFSHRLTFHGRAICVARKPRCRQCPVAQWCPSAEL